MSHAIIERGTLPDWRRPLLESSKVPVSITTRDALNFLLAKCVEMKASDIRFVGGQPVWARISGVEFRLTERTLNAGEVSWIAQETYGGSHALSKLAGGSDLDTAYQFQLSRIDYLRFRVNTTQIQGEGNTTIKIILRHIPQDIPLWQDLGIPEIIVRNFCPHQGVVFVTGPTGSGKTTTIASLFRNEVEDEHKSHSINTYEAPIEFVYSNLTMPRSSIFQAEVPRDLPSFAAGVRNSMRGAPTGVLIGESRDAETMGATLEVANTGHTAWTTSHTNGVVETFQRVLSLFPGNERAARATQVAGAIRGVVTQNLFRRVDRPGRCAAHEYLFFDHAMRMELMATSSEKWPPLLIEMLKQAGRSMASSVEEKYHQGIIAEHDFHAVALSAQRLDEIHGVAA